MIKKSQALFFYIQSNFAQLLNAFFPSPQHCSPVCRLRWQVLIFYGVKRAQYLLLRTQIHKHTNTQIQTHNCKCTTTVLIFYGMKSAQRLLSTKTFGKGTFLQFLSSGLSKGTECFITASNHQNHYSFKSATLS